MEVGMLDYQTRARASASKEDGDTTAQLNAVARRSVLLNSATAALGAAIVDVAGEERMRRAIPLVSESLRQLAILCTTLDISLAQVAVWGVEEAEKQWRKENPNAE